MSLELLRVILQLIISGLFVVVAWQLVSVWKEMGKLLGIIRCQARMIRMLHMNMAMMMAQLGHTDKAIQQTEEMAQVINKINELLD